MSNRVPKWLTNLNNLHFNLALRTLSSRELARDNARNANRKSNLYYPTLQVISKDHIPTATIEHYSVDEAYEPANQLYNRYMDVPSYDRTRVIVDDQRNESHDSTDKEKETNERYFAANWVRELFGGKWWIATQAPLPNTVHVFLSVLMQPVARPPPSLSSTSSPDMTNGSRIRTVVQLTRTFEGGRRKAHEYFPRIIGQSCIISPDQGVNVPSLKVTLLDSRTIDDAQCVLSTLSIRPISGSSSTDEDSEEQGEPIVFRHLLYSAWPDHGVPEDLERFLKFIRLVDLTNKDISSASRDSIPDADLDPDPPIMVNCSAGIGRTGTFIALSSLLRAYHCLSGPPSSEPTHVTALSGLPPSPLGDLPENLRDDLVVQEIDSLREQRPKMVERDEQTLLIYRVLVAGFG
jgi:protein tyrosine phosphatase